VYGVNVDPIPPKDGIQIIQFLSKLGHYMLPDGKDVYESTTCMIDAVAEDIKSHIGEISKFDKVDLAIASMIIPVPPSLMLANELMTYISEDDILSQFNKSNNIYCWFLHKVYEVTELRRAQSKRVRVARMAAPATRRSCPRRATTLYT